MDLQNVKFKDVHIETARQNAKKNGFVEEICKLALERTFELDGEITLYRTQDLLKEAIEKLSSMVI